jgi:hypothetical protein
MKTNDAATQTGHRARRISGNAQRDHIIDPYMQQHKLPDGTRCPQCGAAIHEGRWQWRQSAHPAHEALCPACRRVNDHFPAGSLKLSGEFALAHKYELIRLARHQEATEVVEHPLNRIISIEEDPDGLMISTSDIHLPRRIGEAMVRAYDGEFRMHFDEAGYFVRASWTRPA